MDLLASKTNNSFLRETETAVLGLPANERGDQLAPGWISSPLHEEEMQRTLEVPPGPGGGSCSAALPQRWANNNQTVSLALASKQSRDGTAK